MPENFLPKSQDTFIIEQKFISRKNNVFLVAVCKDGEKDKYIVQKKYSRPDRMSGEVKMLSMLKKKGVAVPRIFGKGENYLLLEYLKGQLFLDYYCRQENMAGSESSAIAEPVCRAILSLCSWFKDFYAATKEIAGRQLIMGDVNFRNFIIGRKGKVYGIDLEECRQGKIEEDFGSLCAYALTYSPTFTPWKWTIVRRLIKLFCLEFNLDKELIKKEIQKELFIMAERRGTLDEIANLPLPDLLEKSINSF